MMDATAPSKHLLLLAVVLALQGRTVASTDPATLLQQLETPTLDPQRGVAVSNLVVDLGAARLEIESGHLFPAMPVGGRVFELEFLGEAFFTMEPPDVIEASQLEILTGRTKVELRVDSATLIMGRATHIAALFEREIDPDAPFAAAVEMFDKWAQSAERKVLGVRSSLLKAALDDPAFQDYVLVYCHAPSLPQPFVYTINPSEQEAVTLGQFVPLDLDDVEQYKLEREVQREQRKGRLSDFDFATLGRWHVWISTDQGNKGASVYGLDPKHYVIDVAVDPEKLSIAATTRISFRAVSDDLKIATLDLTKALEVESVIDHRSGSASFFHRDGGELHVVLDPPARVGDEFDLEFRYAGEILNKWDRGIFYLASTIGWYPSNDTWGNSTFDVTLPNRLELLAGGTLRESGEDGSMRWERRTQEQPSKAFSFEIGAYDVTHSEVEGIPLTLAFSNARGGFDKGAKDDVVATLEGALAFYQKTFGAYPFERLTVVTVPRAYSQGLPGFLTLSHFLLATPHGYVRWLTDPDRQRKEIIAQRKETVAHELAHQWWGNKVGWSGYRDQWLSEALADYSAVQYMANVEKSKALYLAGHAEHWRSSTSETTDDGRTYETLGPVVLGTRLLDNFGLDPYRAIVYDKGSVVFHMLANVLKVGPFNEMLKVLAERVNHRAIDTETFLASIERMSGVDLDPFAAQFIYGTGIHEVYYDYEFLQRDDAWVIEGTATQVGTARYAFDVFRNEKGTWSVARKRMPSSDVASRVLNVPFQVALADRESSKVGTARGLGGMLNIVGERTKFEIPLNDEPEKFWLDQRGEVLATFYDRRIQPKKMRRYEAMEFTGEAEEAALLDALELEALSKDVAADRSEKLLERQARLEDAEIYLELTEHYLREQNPAKARAALAEATARYRGLEAQVNRLHRIVLGAWINVMDGKYKDAYSALSEILYLDFPRLESDTGTDAARRKKFKEGVVWSGDAYALLAASAFETGNGKVGAMALKTARESAVDVSQLEAEFGERPAP